MPNPFKCIIWGSSGHAKVLLDGINLLGGLPVAIFDNSPDAFSVVPNLPLQVGINGFLTWVKSNTEKEIIGYVAIGGARGQDRFEIQQTLTSHGIDFQAFIHPMACVSPTSKLGLGVQVLANSIVAADCVVGEASILNHGACLDHESIVGRGVHLGPRSIITGCVSIGDFSFVGAGAVILPRINIGKNSVIGAGAIVTKNVPDDVVVVGNPARLIRKLK